MELSPVREGIAELAAILFGLGPIVANTNTGHEPLRLLSALGDLDKYVRELEVNSSKLGEAGPGISREIDRVLDITKEAQASRVCSHYKETSASETQDTGCEICGLRVQLISIKLQQRIGRLQSALSESSEGFLLENIILKGVYASYNPKTGSDLSEEIEPILIKIHTLNLELAKNNIQLSQSPITDSQQVNFDSVESTTESKPDICERCNAPNDIISKFEKSERDLIKAKDELKVLKVERVETLKSQDFGEAAKLYEELCTLEMCTMDRHRSKGDEVAARESEDKYLTYRYELAELLHRLGRSREALPIAEETWERREKIDKFGVKAKESHQQYCMLLGILGRFTEAEDLYRKACTKEMMDSDAEWAIRSGLQLGILLIKNERRPEAGIKHWEMYEEGKLSARLGLKHSLVIEIAEYVVQREEELEREKPPRPNHGRMDKVLMEIWEIWATNSTNTPVKVLALVQKLGSRLYAAKDYPMASSILQKVWTRQCKNLGESSPEALSSAEDLFKSYFDGEKYKDAVRVGEWIVERRDNISKKSEEANNALHSLGLACIRSNKLAKAKGAFLDLWQRQQEYLGVDHISTLEAGHDYGEILARIGMYPAARDVLSEVWERRTAELGESNLATLETGREYGKTLEKLGNILEAEEVFTKVWDNAKTRLALQQPTDSERSFLFASGERLASTLEGQSPHDKIHAAIRVYQELLDKRKAEPRSAEILNYGYRLGRCQYITEDDEKAEKQLGQIWEQREHLWLEDFMETGRYLCLAMLENRKKKRKFNYERTKGIINEVFEKASDKYEAEPERIVPYKKVKDDVRHLRKRSR